MARKKINQSDLRRLMKERSENVSKEEKVESPLAKYDKFGKLSCIACDEEVKIPWRHHILSKRHKENINKKLKRKNQDIDDEADRSSDVPKSKVQIISSDFNRIPVNGRSARQDESKNDLSKVSSSSSLQKEPITKQNTSLIAEYSSSSDENEMDDDDVAQQAESSKLSALPKDLSDALPPGFFDAQPSTSSSFSTTPSVHSQNNHVAETPKMDLSSAKASSEAEGLPEGFFDDPVLDAKARKVEYKDPMEEEWEKFQKTMAEEANVSRKITEEDLVKSEVEKDIDQIDQMIFNWKKVNSLQSKQDCLKNQKKCNKMEVDNEENTDSSVEEEELEYLLDWRATGATKK